MIAIRSVQALADVLVKLGVDIKVTGGSIEIICEKQITDEVMDLIKRSGIDDHDFFNFYKKRLEC